MVGFENLDRRPGQGLRGMADASQACTLSRPDRGGRTVFHNRWLNRTDRTAKTVQLIACHQHDGPERLLCDRSSATTGFTQRRSRYGETKCNCSCGIRTCSVSPLMPCGGDAARAPSSRCRGATGSACPARESRGNRGQSRMALLTAFCANLRLTKCVFFRKNRILG